MKNLFNVSIFVILNFIIIFNIIPILGAIIGIIIAYCYLVLSPYDSGFAMLIPIFIMASMLYFWVLPVKFILYPILYEYLKPSNIIYKLFEHIRTKKSTAIIALGITIIIDILVYLYVPKSSIVSEDGILQLYKKSQVFGLTACMLSLLLWFKIRKPKNNGKRLLLFYLILAIIFSVILFIFREYIMDMF